MINSQKFLALAVAAATAVTFACSKSPGTPVSPSGNTGGTDAAADGSTLKVTAPTPVSPIGGALVEDLDPDLVIANATPLFVASLNLSYVFEVIDEDGQLVYRSNPIPAGAGGRTTHEINKDLDENEAHTWRVRAVLDGRQGPMSATASFTTFLPGPPGPSCAGAGAEAAIVACRKAQFGFIHKDELPEFLRAVAFDLNRAGHEWAPYGRLLKDTGNNCHGYACDIICSDKGMHRQWDILQDEDELQGPKWDRVGEPTPRPCEVVLR